MRTGEAATRTNLKSSMPSADEVTIAGRIRKLLWLGYDEEADRMTRLLLVWIPLALHWPPDTD